MILRRFMQHVKEQNWFAVGLDVIVVIVGIFLGLQVQGWYEAKQDRLDEQTFLVSLRKDVILAEQLSERKLNRMLDRTDILIRSADIIFGRIPAVELSEAECTAIASSHSFNITISEFPSLEELISTGRISIIQNKNLRTSVLGFQQISETLTSFISLQSASNVILASKYPELIKLESIYDPEQEEIRSVINCNLDAMRSNDGFLNDFSENIDVYDAFIKDGLRPWSEKLTDIHTLLDTLLNTSKQSITMDITFIPLCNFEDRLFI